VLRRRKGNHIIKDLSFLHFFRRLFGLARPKLTMPVTSITVQADSQCLCIAGRAPWHGPSCPATRVTRHGHGATDPDPALSLTRRRPAPVLARAWPGVLD
jgi:hypothetical protein